jgi:predicted NBD/HSP70 family sugar kinase
MRTVADLHQANAFSVIRAIHASGVRTRRELARDTGLSFTTVASICGNLIQQGVVKEAGLQRSPIGRPTATLLLNPDHGVFIGVDVAETYVLVETLDASLGPVTATRRDIDPHKAAPREVLARVREAVLAEHARHDERRLLGVGLSVPGQINQATGESVFAPYWGWRNIPVLDMLAPGVPAPLYLDNPLKALVVSQVWTHPERSQDDFAVINLGTGVGAAFAIEGRVHRGSTNTAGEWGHTVLIADGRACRCGSRGCLEAYIGAPGILQTLREAHPESELLHSDDQAATLDALSLAAARGDAAASDVLERTAHFFGTAVASMINFLNPSRIIVTGWVADKIGADLVQLASPHIKAHALAVPLMSTILETQPTGNSVCLGSAAQAFEGYLDSLLDSSRESPNDPQVAQA